MPQDIKPMKAPSESLRDLTALTYPRLASAKIDGMRCMGLAGQPHTSTMSPFRNRHLNLKLAGRFIDGLDGELVVGAPHGEDVLKRTKVGLTAADGEPDFHWHLFDDYSAVGHFERRFGGLQERLSRFPTWLRERVHVVPHCVVRSADELADFESACLAQGYEGAMVRDPAGPYKFGRATAGQGWLFKLKRFEDAEAVVVRLEEAMTNANEAVRRGDGGIKRSTSREGLVPAGLVGTIVACDVGTGREVRIGPGRLTAQERIRYWREPSLLVGRVVTYKFFPYGEDRAPRHPTFKAVRDPSDFSPD